MLGEAYNVSVVVMVGRREQDRPSKEANVIKKTFVFARKVGYNECV